MLVCHCTVVSDGRIRELVDDGAVDLLDVASVTGAGSFCGGCVPAIASVLSRATGQPISSLLDRTPSRVDDDAPPLPTRVRQVVRAVEEEVRGTGRSGAPVTSIEDLCRSQGASRGVVRDALTVMASHGLVRPESPSSDAYVVGEPDVVAVQTLAASYLCAAGVDAVEVLEVRRVLEMLALQCACHHPDPVALEHFLAVRASGGDDVDDPGFHRDVVAVTGNPVLRVLLEVVLALERPLTGAQNRSADHADHVAVEEALACGDGATAVQALAAHLARRHRSATEMAGSNPLPRVACPGAPPATPLDVLRATLGMIRSRGLEAGDVIGGERDVADGLGIDRRTLLAAHPLLEYHAVATRQPGPRATLAVASPDPWPSAELLALVLEDPAVAPGQLLHVRQALEVRAVELAADRIDERAAVRLRRRLDEEAAAFRRDHLRDRVFHTIHPVIATLSGNRALAHAAIAVNLALLRRANRDPDLARLLASGVGELTQAHAAIVDAATRGDRAGSRQLMEDHVSRHGGHPTTTGT